MRFAAWAIIIFLSVQRSTVHGQLTFAEGMDAAKSISSDRLEQIKALEELTKSKSRTSYRDSLGQIYYAIAYRYRILGRDVDVISASEKAIALFQEAKAETYQYSFSLSFLGESYQAIGQIDRSLEAYQQILDRTPKGRDFSIYGYAAFRLAQMYQEVEDHQTALDIIISVLDGPYKEELSELDVMDLNLAASIALSNLPGSNTAEANRYLQTAKDIATSSPDVDEFQKIEITLEEAALEVNVGKFEKAAQIYNQALLQLESFKEEYDYINAEAASIASNASYAFYKMGAYNRAVEFAERSLGLFDKYGDKYYTEIEALLYSNMAAAQRGQGNFRTALDYGEKGLSLFTDTPWQESRQKRWILDLLYSKVQTLEKQGNNKEALSIIFQLDSLFDTYIEDQLSSYSVRQLQKKGVEYYKLGIDLSVRLNNAESYWYLSEKIKGLRLLRAHIERRVSGKGEIGTKLDQVKRDILLQEYLLDFSLDDEVDSLRAVIGKLKSERVALASMAEASEEAKMLAITPLASLDHDTPIIQFQSGQDKLYGCLVDEGIVNIISIGDYKTLTLKIEELRTYLENPDSDLRALKTLANELYHMLWKPFAVDVEQITILPDEVLSFLPFDILVNDNGEYLVSNHEVGYSISGTFLDRSLKKAKRVRHIDFIKPSYQQSGGLPPLPYAQKESELIDGLYDIHMVEGKSVYKKTLDSVFSTSSVFHFSGHAIADRGSDERSYLALGDGDSVDDRLLLGELYSLRTPAQLVVLSACNTGVGSIIEGEGVESLTRGFLYAGSKSVINTLWTVDDQSTSNILGSVYQYLKESAPKSTALRLSKLDYLAKAEAYQKHPYYWAGIVVVGDLSPLEKYSINWSKHALVLLLFVLAGWFLTWRFKKKPPPRIEFLGNILE